MLLSPRLALAATLLALLAASTPALAQEAAFRASFPDGLTRTWLSPALWANPMQDWRIHEGRLECLRRGADRNVHVLTHQLGARGDAFAMTVRLGLAGEGEANLDGGWVGFRAGAQGRFDDYRDSAIYGTGLDAGLSTDGTLFIGEPAYGAGAALPGALREALRGEGLRLTLRADALSDDAFRVRLALADATGTVLDETETTIADSVLVGNLALVASYDRPGGLGDDPHAPSFWFDDWTIAGNRIEAHPEQTFGPVYFSLYTLSEGVLKMTAQLPPMSDADGQTVAFQTQEDDAWATVAEAPIDPLARTATFRLPAWDDTADVPYRLAYTYTGEEGAEVGTWSGTVRRDPVDKPELVVAGFTGNNDLGFPHSDLVRGVEAHEPDVLVFTGDQLYESVGRYGYLTEPVELAAVDYLRKWLLFGWEYRELTRDIPTVCLPDDHDVYHGNLWGVGGKQTIQEGTKKEMQDSGGYIMPPEWVNMVERTQTAHLPDPADPTPVKQGIGVYYTDLTYGGVSFAVIEDRKFKSAPKSLLSADMDIENGWAENMAYRDAADFEAPDGVLLGHRQMRFLEDWTHDWSNGAWMKVLLSQTIFATVATLPDSAVSDVVVPTLRIGAPDFYPPNDRPTQDMDSNGWPAGASDEVLRTIRKGFAFHLAGDQHLGSTIHYGVDDWGDAGYAVCVPSVANFWPRRWFPRTPGQNRPPGAPPNTGDFLDGFGNHITVLAVSNPVYTGREPSALYDRAAGYGIVRLERDTRQLEIALWPRGVDPDAPGAAPYDGWPITISQTDNYGRDAAAWLPTIQVTGMEDPVVQIVDEATAEIVYTLRIEGQTFEPKVFAEGLYTVRVGDPDGVMQAFEGVEALGAPGAAVLTVDVSEPQ